MASRTTKSQEDIELSGGRRKARIAPKRQNSTEKVGGAERHKSVKQPKGKRMAAEGQGESRMTRRTQNSQESIYNQEGAGLPVQLQAVSVEHHRRKLRGDLWGPEHNSFAAASAVNSTSAACCRIQSEASAEVWEPRPHISPQFSIHMEHSISRQPKSHERRGGCRVSRIAPVS